MEERQSGVRLWRSPEWALNVAPSRLTARQCFKEGNSCTMSALREREGYPKKPNNAAFTLCAWARGSGKKSQNCSNVFYGWSPKRVDKLWGQWWHFLPKSCSTSWKPGSAPPAAYLDIYIWLSMARERGIRNEIQHLAIAAAGNFLVYVASSATTLIMFPALPGQGLHYLELVSQSDGLEFPKK